jgi:hypothetical protein
MRLKSEHISIDEAIELGSLEIRKLFKDLNPTALDKKVNVDYLEKELGLRRFFPQSVIDAHKVCSRSLAKRREPFACCLAESPAKMHQSLFEEIRRSRGRRMCETVLLLAEKCLELGTGDIHV